VLSEEYYTNISRYKVSNNAITVWGQLNDFPKIKEILKETTEENEIILLALHQTQEELEAILIKEQQQNDERKKIQNVCYY
jgi:hypothetical protein